MVVHTYTHTHTHTHTHCLHCSAIQGSIATLDPKKQTLRSRIGTWMEIRLFDLRLLYVHIEMFIPVTFCLFNPATFCLDGGTPHPGVHSSTSSFWSTWAECLQNFWPTSCACRPKPHNLALVLIFILLLFHVFICYLKLKLKMKIMLHKAFSTCKLSSHNVNTKPALLQDQGAVGAGSPDQDPPPPLPCWPCRT